MSVIQLDAPPINRVETIFPRDTARDRIWRAMMTSSHQESLWKIY